MALKPSSIDFKIQKLPFWKGVLSSPIIETFPFEVSWYDSGFLRQTTESSILESIYTAYANEDYQFISPPPGASQWGNELAQFYFQEFISHCGTANNKHILEIGAGNTGFAKLILEKFDIASYTIIDPAIHDDIDGITIVRDFFPCKQVRERSYDLIISLNTIEHVQNPSSFLENLSHLLTSHSMTFISLPDAGSQIMSGDLSVLLHEHINYFSIDTFQTLSKRKGLLQKKVTIKNDSIFASQQLHSTENSKYSNFPNLRTWEDGMMRLKNVLEGFGAYLETFGETGSIVFHGATPGLNNFLYLTNLGNCPNIEITDGDKEKHGNFLPAHSRPITPPYDTLYQDADLIIISAPSFKEPIESFIRNFVPDSKPIIPLSYDGLTMIKTP